MSGFARISTGFELDETCLQRWCVARRPEGNVRADDFELKRDPVPDLNEGEVLLQTLYLSLAPVMRGYMSGQAFAGETPLAIGDTIHGRGVAQIAKSRHPDWLEGEIVQGQLGWQTCKVSKMTPDEKFRRMPPNGLPASLGLGALGMTGLSAWAGFYSVGQPERGDTVLVSGAVGGVGSLVIQMAANVSGCRTVGIAGGPDKCANAAELGCDATIDYKTDALRAALADALPDGLDLYFDNVGGPTLDAALDHLRLGARIVLCGSISEYTLESPYRLPDYTRLRRCDAQMRGFFVYNHLGDWDRAMDEMAGWIRAGKVTPVEQITDGFEQMPAALAGLYFGENIGKQLCRVRGEPREWI
jgi:hypothetical protein